MKRIRIATRRHSEMVAVTRQVEEASLEEWGDWDGMLYVHSPHTTAGVTLNEQADPDVARDMVMELQKLVPWEDGYAHSEGNSAAHILTTLTGPGVWIPVERGRLRLGRWQGVWFCEYDGPRDRELWLTAIKSST